MADAGRVPSSFGRRIVGSGRPAHRIFTGAVSLCVLLLTGVLTWFLTQGASWALAPIIITIVYGVGAVLFRLESTLRYPVWLAQAVGALAEFWPPIKWLRTSAEVQSMNEAFVDDFNRTLDEYLLEEFDSKSSQELAGHLFPLSTRTLAVAWTKEHAAAPEGEPPAPSADALELLHHERSGQITIHVWQARGEKLLDELVQLVRRSPRVPAPDPIHPYTDSDVRTLLGALRDFNLELLGEELLIVNRIGGRLQRYAEFLAPDGSNRVPGVISLLADQELGELPAGPSTLFRLESPAETLRLMEAVEDCGDEVLGAVHRGIFLAERDIDTGPLKERACAVLLELSRDGGSDPVRVLRAYLWEKGRREKDRHTGDQIDLRELDRHWKQWSREAEADLNEQGPAFDADLNQLAERLEAGIWPTRRFSGNGIAYPLSQPTLVPEHEEVRDLDAYLITFDERHGPLGTLVDGLKKPGSIYRFGPYTRNTRLGIVPHGMPFHEFVDRLLVDLDDALHHYAPGFGSDGSADDGALRFAPGRPRSILLRHAHACEGPIDFEISQPPGRCEGSGEVAPAEAADGQLGEIEPWPGRLDRALVRYFPESVEKPRRVCFSVTSTCPHETTTRTVPLLVGARRRDRRLDQIEVTVNRVDLAHCRELGFGDPVLKPAMRAPSIYDVWREVEPELDRDEKEPVKAAFERFLVGQASTGAQTLAT